MGNKAKSSPGYNGNKSIFEIMKAIYILFLSVIFTISAKSSTAQDHLGNQFTGHGCSVDPLPADE